VDGIERELAGRARVVRLNMLSAEGRELAVRWGVRGVPTLIVLDGRGETTILRQVGRLQKDAVLEVMAQIEQG